jgi:primosomal protein N' (replication factor Y) (superfamily II helicase)
MFYYEVIINSASYRGKKVLTYHHTGELPLGAIIKITLRQEPALGFVSRRVPKPKGFTTKAVDEVFDLPPLPQTLVQLANWLPTYYPAGMGVIGQQFLPRTLPHKSISSISPGEQTMPASPIQSLPPLTSEQQVVINRVCEPNTFLLHGETGSGKTRVYLELTRQSLRKGQSAIILTPEIALTPQLTHAFEMQFGNQVVVTHSRLTEAERRNIWLQALTTERPLVVIGPRSALFSPLKDVGLIVVDESHEPSYKQEQSPHYLTTRVAGKLASLRNAPLILGSATPSITDYYIAEQQQKPILRMTQVAQKTTATPAKIEIIDLRDRSQFSKKPHLANELLSAIQKSLHAGEQSLLFLNRRGTARVILCENCGWQATCEHCNLPLTYHADNHTMRCHTCGRTKPLVHSCPLCRSTGVLFKSIGTKAIYDEVVSVFPQARIQRFDTDNKKDERIERHYEAIRSGEVDILVGTQLLAKGLDLPKLSVVGVVSADTSLYLPDYTAGERTFQLLRQVIGRVGRGHREGHVIIQTYSPENHALQAAAKNRWNEFYQHELSERRQFIFPPYCYLLKLSCRMTTHAAAEKKAEKLINLIKNSGAKVLLEGPAPTAHEKIGKKYQWQIVAKAKQRGQLSKVISILPSGWIYDIDPINLL